MNSWVLPSILHPRRQFKAKQVTRKKRSQIDTSLTKGKRRLLDTLDEGWRYSNESYKFRVCNELVYSPHSCLCSLSVHHFKASRHGLTSHVSTIKQRPSIHHLVAFRSFTFPKFQSAFIHLSYLARSTRCSGPVSLVTVGRAARPPRFGFPLLFLNSRTKNGRNVLWWTVRCFQGVC